MNAPQTQHDHENDVVYFARTNYRNQMHKFGIKTDDRRRHMYILGKTGMGKTTFIENMILADIYKGHGCAYVDPHGDTAEKILDYIPSWRINDVVYFNPGDIDHPMGFNILESVDENSKHLVASGLMGVFQKIWANMWSARMEYILNNTVLALMDHPGSTLLGINRMFSDAEYRKTVISTIKDPIVKQFWIQEFGSYSEKFATEAVAAVQNKVGQFLSASILRNIVAQVKSTFNVREIMDENKIFIVNLAKGRIGEDNSRLLGGMIITKIQLAAMGRVDIPNEKDREDFYLYVDEFQNFAVESFASILSEARKYRLNLTVAHQYIAQLSEEVRDSVFGNVGTIITFRVGAPDALFLANEFIPVFTENDLINLPKFNIYLRLMIDGVASQPFSAITLPPIAIRTGSQETVIKVSRERYSTPREKIEEKVLKWSGMGEDVDTEKMMAEVEEKKKSAKKKKFMHEYDCSRCGKHMEIPVELDRSRPIYCTECIEIVKSGRKDSKPFKKPEKIDDGELVVKQDSQTGVSLSQLSEKNNDSETPAPIEKVVAPKRADVAIPPIVSNAGINTQRAPQAPIRATDRPQTVQNAQVSSSGGAHVGTSGGAHVGKNRHRRNRDRAQDARPAVVLNKQNPLPKSTFTSNSASVPEKTVPQAQTVNNQDDKNINLKQEQVVKFDE